MTDFETANISDRLRAALRFLTEVVPAGGVVAEATLDALAKAGIGRVEAEEVLHVVWCFIVISKWANALDFPITPPEAFKPVGRMMYRFGYKSVSVGPSW
ncbi:MAG: hypothetical protein AAGN82_30140 [Myxococcota bacterium]